MKLPLSPINRGKIYVLTQCRMLHKAGYSPRQIAKELRVDERTLLKWASEDGIDWQSGPRFERLVPIEKAIEVLISLDQFNFNERLFALFRFSLWLRWPEEDVGNPIGVISCFATYYQQKESFKFLSDLTKDAKLIFEEKVELSVLQSLTDGNSLFPILITERSVDKDHYSDHDAIAEIVRYLLSEPDSKTRSQRRSLGKVQKLLEAGAFDCQFDKRKHAFTRFWRTHGASGPFLFVERFNPGDIVSFDFRLSPDDPDFAASVDEILSKKDELRNYFSVCKWAVIRFRENFDPVALSHLMMPRIPDTLAARDQAPPSLPKKLSKFIRKNL